MVPLTVITTGLTTQMGAVRTQEVRRAILDHGGTVKSSSNPRHPEPSPRFTLHVLVIWALYGLDHAGIAISVRSLQSRISLGGHIAGQLLTVFRSTGWLEVTGKDTSQLGRGATTYRLTAQGRAIVRQWFTHTFRGSCVSAHFKSRHQVREVKRELRTMPGVIVPQVVERAPVPYSATTTALMVGWVLEQARVAINASDIAERLLCSSATIHDPTLHTLQDRGFLVAAAASQLQLSKGAVPVAYQYLASLLT